LGVNPVAAAGFDAEAAAYERSRPTYPADAVAWLVDTLGIDARATVADVAAGTGKLTRLLVPTSATIVAVEPVAGMRAQLRRAVPSARIVAAQAEALPFGAGTLDAVTVAQAFHWFDRARALPELHRVLRPGGRVGVVSNDRDTSEPWVGVVWAALQPEDGRSPFGDHEEWHETGFDDQPWFTPLSCAEFANEQVLTPDQVVDRLRSISYVAALPPARQQEALDRIRAVIDEHPGTAGRDTVVLPYRARVWWAERLDISRAR
jgi:SAM-dependent methyltransferase